MFIKNYLKYCVYKILVTICYSNYFIFKALRNNVNKLCKFVHKCNEKLIFIKQQFIFNKKWSNFVEKLVELAIIIGKS